MRNIIYGAVLATLVLLSLAFTSYSKPPRHLYPAIADAASSNGRRVILTTAGSDIPTMIPSNMADPIMSVSTGLGGGALLATGTIYSATRVLAANTRLASMTLYVSVASSATAANEVFTVTDGTNTCTFTYACDATTGTKNALAADGAGTGCTYAADADLTFSLTTQGCATAMTVKSIVIQGYARP